MKHAVRYVLLPVFEQLTGYTVKAAERKIEAGVWREGEIWTRSAAGPRISLDAFEAWVERREPPALWEFCTARRKPAPGEHGQRRRAALKRQTPLWADLRAIETVYLDAQRLTRETGIRHEVDHVIPLLGRNVCGLHVEANLRIITAAENAAKSNRCP